jgi:hypothetical protein
VLFGWGTALAAQLALRAGLRAPTPRGRWLAVHWRLSAVLAPVEIVVWLLIDTPQPFWPTWAILGIATALAVHILVQRTLPPSREKELAERVDALARSRRGVVDVQSAELKRIERDLHDGAQARMVSLAMNLGLAEQLARRDPDAATELIAEARHSALAALDELRTVMSGIQPPVLSDHGLADTAGSNLGLDLLLRGAPLRNRTVDLLLTIANADVQNRRTPGKIRQGPPDPGRRRRRSGGRPDAGLPQRRSRFPGRRGGRRSKGG